MCTSWRTTSSRCEQDYKWPTRQSSADQHHSVRTDRRRQVNRYTHRPMYHGLFPRFYHSEWPVLFNVDVSPFNSNVSQLLYYLDDYQKLLLLLNKYVCLKKIFLFCFETSELKLPLFQLIHNIAHPWTTRHFKEIKWTQTHVSGTGRRCTYNTPHFSMFCSPVIGDEQRCDSREVRCFVPCHVDQYNQQARISGWKGGQWHIKKCDNVLHILIIPIFK